MDTKTLCAEYAQLGYRERLERLFSEFDRVLVTSSFGTSSATFLHLLHQVKPDHPIYFVDTTYHFAETHAYRRTLSTLWELNVIPVRPKANENMFTKVDFTWTHEPDACCYVNKVLPLAELKNKHQVWISGMVGGSTTHRQQLPIFKEKEGLLRFYPLLDMTKEEAEWNQVIYDLPKHPLEDKGYGSVGCAHCTIPGKGREGRWAGNQKTECGLHVH
ncbi:MAG: phosphoadenylyl-sulfate reductase [Bacteroidota bacterium]